MQSYGDKLSATLGPDLPHLANIEARLPTEPDGADYGEGLPDDYLGDDDEAAREIARRYMADQGAGAYEILDGLLNRFEQARDKLDGDDWLRVDRVIGVIEEALSFVEDADRRWADGDNEDREISNVPPPGWRRSEILAAFTRPPDEAERAMLGFVPLAPRTAPRRRGAGRPRGMVRSSSRGGEGSSDPDLPWPARGLAVCPCCGNTTFRSRCSLCGGLGFVGRKLRNDWKDGQR